jgi:uncharacterized protein (TIGR01777 family)
VRVVVTGATGFIGRRLIDRLIDAGHAVTAISRDLERARALLPVRCHVEAWDGRSATSELLSDVDAVVHLAGAGVADKRWTSKRKDEIRESRVAGSHALVASIAELPRERRPKALVAASAIGYYGDRGDETLTEQSPVGQGFLAEVCGAWEREIFVGSSLGVRTAVVRIGIVLGPSGGALQKMQTPFRLGLGGRLGRGNQWMSWIHLEDIVGLLVFAVENSHVSGPINGVAPQPVTNADFTTALARSVHKPALLPVPAIALRAAMGEMSSLLLASQRVVPRAATDLGYTYQFPQLAGALEDLCSDFSHERRSEQWLPLPPGEVFSFFSDVNNLERLTPDFLHFHVLGVDSAEVGEGTVIDYRLRLHGIPLRWRSVIEDWSPGRRFVDRQTRGPYARWVHTHEFESHDGGTLVRDRVCYALPLSPLSDLVAGSMVERDLDRIFAYRRRRLEDLLT